MAIGVEAIINAIRASVLATTPDVLPAVAFKEAPGTGSLSSQKMRTDEVARFFRLYPRIDSRGDWWNGSLTHLRQTIVLELRYRVPDARGGETRARLMAGSDSSRLLNTVTRNFEISGAPELTSIDQLPSRQLRSLGRNTWLSEIEYEVTYFLGDESAPPVISP